MGTIIPIPTFVDPANPTPDETAADTLYKARMQTGRDNLSPDIRVRFTTTTIPDTIMSEAGALLICERQVMKDANRTATQIAAFAEDSDEKIALVHATLIRRAIQLLPQAAQMTREGLLGDTRQFQEIDWQQREKEMEGQYQAAVKVVNPSATFDDTDDGSLGSPTVLATKSTRPKYR